MCQSRMAGFGLYRLGMLSGRIDNIAADRNPATAHMFIVSPLHMQAVDSLFATHSQIEKRIAKLRVLGGETRCGSSRGKNDGPWG